MRKRVKRDIYASPLDFQRLHPDFEEQKAEEAEMQLEVELRRDLGYVPAEGGPNQIGNAEGLLCPTTSRRSDSRGRPATPMAAATRSCTCPSRRGARRRRSPAWRAGGARARSGRPSSEMLAARVILTHVIQYQFARLITLVNALRMISYEKSDSNSLLQIMAVSLPVMFGVTRDISRFRTR